MRLDVRSLSHTFPGRPPRAALNGVSFDAAEGQFVAVIGPSGCGKSTLLRLIAGLLPVQQGSISLGESRRKVAWMSQRPALLPWLTVRANASLASRFQKHNGAAHLSAEEALERVGLSDALNAYPFMLSGGMQQRLALARTLTLDANLWLMDEPFASLDELTRERLAMELLALWEPLRPTVLWVTHNIYEALRMADRVLVLSPRPGSIIADLPVELPRPRQESDPQFQSMLAELRAALSLELQGAQL